MVYSTLNKYNNIFNIIYIQRGHFCLISLRILLFHFYIYVPLVVDIKLCLGIIEKNMTIGLFKRIIYEKLSKRI